MINGHGDDIYNQDKRIVSNFSSNVYGRQDMSELDEYLCLHIDLIHSYPEPDAASLAKLLAAKNNLLRENVLVTNGATEAIYMIAQAFQRKRSAVIYPTFSEYADACLVNNHNITWASSLDKIDREAELVWLCNPNNPTGKVFDKNMLTSYIEASPNQYIIIDQSYEYFTTKELLSPYEAVKYKNVVLLHSMTKQYAVPGLRLGYVIAHQDVLSQIRRYCMPWSVNALAIEAGKYLLKEAVDVLDISSYLGETRRLQQELEKITNLTVFPTDTHFFLCKLKDMKAADLKVFLIKEYGILIRDAANFYGLDESWFRIATQSVEENNMLIKAVGEWIRQK